MLKGGVGRAGLGLPSFQKAQPETSVNKRRLLFLDECNTANSPYPVIGGLTNLRFNSELNYRYADGGAVYLSTSYITDLSKTVRISLSITMPPVLDTYSFYIYGDPNTIVYWGPALQSDGNVVLYRRWNGWSNADAPYTGGFKASADETWLLDFYLHGLSGVSWRGIRPLLEETFTSNLIAPRAEQNYTNPLMPIQVQIIIPNGGKLHYFDVVELA